MATTDSNSPPSTGDPQPSITDLSDQLKGLQKHADVSLDEETAQKYLTYIGDFRSNLEYNKILMNKLENLGNPGTLNSATQTRLQLTLDVNGSEGILKLTDSYLSYLDEFEKLVRKSCRSLMDNG